MEQFFGLVNTFLQNNRDTWRRKLSIRTYKVMRHLEQKNWLFSCVMSSFAADTPYMRWISSWMIKFHNIVKEDIYEILSSNCRDTVAAWLNFFILVLNLLLLLLLFYSLCF